MSGIDSKIDFVQAAIAELKANRPQPLPWEMQEALRVFRRALPADDPSVEYAAYLANSHPLSMPKDFDLAEFGLIEESGEDEWAEAYQRELEKYRRVIKRGKL